MGGIYFGLSPADCSSKALHHGVILKCRVQIGLALKHDKCKDHTFASLIKEKRDCVWGNIGYKSKSYIIYSWDQVQVAAEVDDKDNVIEWAHRVQMFRTCCREHGGVVAVVVV